MNWNLKFWVFSFCICSQLKKISFLILLHLEHFVKSQSLRNVYIPFKMLIIKVLETGMGPLAPETVTFTTSFWLLNCDPNAITGLSLSHLLQKKHQKTLLMQDYIHIEANALLPGRFGRLSERLLLSVLCVEVLQVTLTALSLLWWENHWWNKKFTLQVRQNFQEETFIPTDFSTLKNMFMKKTLID